MRTEINVMRAASSRRSPILTFMYYVYLLQCADHRTYVGYTNDLRDRIDRHQKGYVDATAGRLPVQCMSYFAFQDKYTAIRFEKYLKSGSGRAFITKHFFNK